MDDLLHEIFHFDVDTYATLIDVRVQIECNGQRNYSGRVYTVDPLTQRFERETFFVLIRVKNRRMEISYLSKRCSHSLFV
jgi:hypothetical protein